MREKVATVISFFFFVSLSTSTSERPPAIRANETTRTTRAGTLRLILMLKQIFLYSFEWGGGEQ